MSSRGWLWLLILILILLLLWLLLQQGDEDQGEPDAPTEGTSIGTNSPPIARNDQLAGCSLASAGGHWSCTHSAGAGTLFADNGSGADTDPDGDTFTAAIAGATVVGGTGEPWSPPGPEGRTCTSGFLCTTDRNFVPAASSLTIAGDGGFQLTYTTAVQPFGTLVAEFLYRVTDAGGAVSDPAYVEVLIN